MAGKGKAHRHSKRRAIPPAKAKLVAHKSKPGWVKSQREHEARRKAREAELTDEGEL